MYNLNSGVSPPPEQIPIAQIQAEVDDAGDDAGDDIVRDKGYYFDDGDIVIRVEDTLFKVHRFLLSRNSVTFRDMFKVCSGSGAAQIDGSDDSTPLILTGDTVKAFRVLLSILYARPYELYSQTEFWAQEDSLDQMLIVAEISNKYRFFSTERLIVKMLTQYVQKFTEHLSQTASAEVLKQAIKVALLVNRPILQRDLERIFATRVLDEEIPPEVALEFGNAHSLRRLQGAAYYALLMSVEDPDPEQLEATKFGKSQGWDDALRFRLLHGYYSLLQICAYMCEDPPFSPEDFKSKRFSQWSDDFHLESDVGSADALALFDTLERELVDSGWSNAVSRLAKEIQKFRDNLLDHFEV